MPAFVFALAFACVFALAFPVIVTLALLMLTLPPDTFVFAALALVFIAMLVFAAFAFVAFAFMLPLVLSAGEQAVQTPATTRRVRSAKVLRI